MAEPPRLPAILLSWEKSIIYFVTICVKDRRKVLGNPEVFDAIKIVITKLQRFDRLLGSDENLWGEWIYVKDNPVRHGFVQRADDWPYYLDFINEGDAGSCQLPLQFRGVGGR